MDEPPDDVQRALSYLEKLRRAAATEDDQVHAAQPAAIARGPLAKSPTFQSRTLLYPGFPYGRSCLQEECDNCIRIISEARPSSSHNHASGCRDDAHDEHVQKKARLSRPVADQTIANVHKYERVV